MLRFVQDQSQPLRQVWQAVRFVDDRKFLSGLMTLQYFARVARSEQDPHVLVQLPRFASKFNAVHSVWHHDIAEQKFELLAASEHRDGVLAISCTNDLITE